MLIISILMTQDRLTRSLLKNINSLQQFKANTNQVRPLYHDAIQLPTFLQNNLKSQHRRVKEFSGEDSLLKAFYFSIMKLGFEIEADERDYEKIVKDILTGNGQFGEGELEDRMFSDKQYRSFLIQFIQILRNQQIASFQETAQFYPIIDQILLNLFRKLVPVTLLIPDQNAQIVAQRVFSFLSKKFQITLQNISGCFKFVQPDIFIYVSHINLVYLIYVDHLAHIREVTEHSSDGITNNLSQTSKLSGSSMMNNNRNEEKKNKNFKTVINILDSNRIIKEERQRQRQRQARVSKQYPANTFRPKENTEDYNQQYYSKPPSLISQKQSISSIAKEGSQYSKERIQPESPQIASPRNRPQNKVSQISHNSNRMAKFDDQGLQSKISPAISKLALQKRGSKFSSQIMSQVKPSKLGLFSNLQQPIKLRMGNQKQDLDDSGYQKFTDSGLLGILDQQYQKQIKSIKKKYREERSKIKNYF